MNEADLVGLTDEQARRYEELDNEIAQSREGIAAWHRLLDRRRLDRKLGRHPIPEFSLAARPEGDEGGVLRRNTPEAAEAVADADPFFLRTETEARGLLMRCIGYLADAEGTKFASDKGHGGRDKMAEWIIREIKEHGALAYITRRKPYLFGIPLAVAAS
jgi:hypothetical protein